MLRFGGFKATFNLKSRKKRSNENENGGEPICGAYRINREEFISNNVDVTKRNTTPIVQMNQPTLKNSKSSNDIINNTKPTTTATATTTSNVRQSMPDIAQPKPVPRINKNEREQKKLEKQQLAEQKKRELAEQKKREKLALQEQQRQEKLKREREKQQKLEQAKVNKNKPKRRAPPQPEVIQSVASAPKPVSRAPTNYSTNTLESSISRSSGPPPYTAEPNLIPNQKDNTGNTSFATPSEDLGTWDIISQHREQLNRPKATSGGSKQTHMDLNYNMVDSRNKDNSDV